MKRCKFSLRVFWFLQVIVFPLTLSAAKIIENPGTPGITQSYIYDDFELIEGVEVADIDFWQEWIDGSYSRRRVIQLKKGSTRGRAEVVFYEPSAKYDIRVTIVEPKVTDSELALLVNGRRLKTIKYGNSYAFREIEIEKVNVQQWSTLSLEFFGTNDARCRVEKIVFTPVGDYDGKFLQLKKPETLKLFETYDEVQKGRRIFYDYVRGKVDEVNGKRNSDLQKLKDSTRTEAIGARWQSSGVEKWKERQGRIRNNLNNYFGAFPERTPLNAQVVGKLEYEQYTIEKVIFESQPGFFVTANLYVPKGRKFPVPGVVFPLGHSDAGKSRDVYHMSGLGLVLKGYVVLVYDPVGQGERSEYIDENDDWLVHTGVDQHWYVGRPAFLTGWTLSGLRTWDGIRAVDYLVSRPEVDKDKLAAVGCSGGGQMAMLITAVDERIKVCAASHPGGPMENTYLTGKKLTDKEIFSLIPPRPLRIIVGIESGEEPRHREYLEDLQLFYDGLRVGRQTAEIDVVPGPHSMNRSNRESAYEWLNKWFDKEAEGKAEDVSLKVEKEADLWCTENGNVLALPGSETGQTLNARRAAEIYNPARDIDVLRNNIAKRIGLVVKDNGEVPPVKAYDLINIDGVSIRKFTYQSENGIVVPALLFMPEELRKESPVYFYVSEKGKPAGLKTPNIPMLLAKEGCVVLAIDVRGTGETSPTSSFTSSQFSGYTPLLQIHDELAVQCAEFGATTLGMRTFDIIKGVDVLNSLDDLKDRKIVAIGEGSGGLWAVSAAVYDHRIDGVVTIGTLPSYMPLLENKYYNNVWEYFWLPGALKDFDIPDLAKLIPSLKQLWINPVNHMGETDLTGAGKYLNNENLALERSNESILSTVKIIVSNFNIQEQ